MQTRQLVLVSEQGRKGLAAPIAMTWRHHDSSVADPFPRPSEYNAPDVSKLREVVISLRRPPLIITMAEFLRLPNFKGCKVVVGTLLLPGTARVTHLAPPAERLEDIPSNTGDMVVAEIPCRKVLDDKEKKKRKAEEKIAAKAPAVNIQAEATVNKADGREGPRKKRRVRSGPPMPPDSGHVSSLTPLNQAKPLEALANEEHVSPPVSVGRMDTLRDQTDEHFTPPRVVYASKLVIDEGDQGNVDASHAIEGHGDNEGGYPDCRFVLALLIPPVDALIPWKSLLLKILCRMWKLVTPLDVSGLPFTPQWGLTDSSRMDNSRECRDMMANLFTPADKEFFNEGQANTLLRFEALKEQHADLAYAHESCKDVKVLYKESDRIKQLEEVLKQSKADAHQLRLEKERYVVEAGRGEMVRQRIINQYLPTFVRRLHQSAEYKRSLGEVFSLAVGKGFMDGISIGREDADIQAILKATPNVDPVSSDTFMDAYEKLFDRRYPYVDKVARMYLLDPSGLQNIMPDETGPTPDGGPRDTPTASYA
ncbi:hypothetical protein Tco_0883109 [Tanacetum coccineum]